MTDSVDLSSNQGVITAVLGVVGLVLTGLISFFGGRGSVQAQLQNQLNETMRLAVATLERRLETNDKAHAETLRGMKVEIRALQSYNIKLVRVLRDNNLDVPPPPQIEPIFVLDSLPQDPPQ